MVSAAYPSRQVSFCFATANEVPYERVSKLQVALQQLVTIFA